MNLKCILHHLIKNSESYRQGMAKFLLQNHQIDPLKSKTSLYLVIPSSEWCQMTCMVIYVWIEEYIMLFRQFRFKFRVWGAKNGEISAENHQNDPWENENTTFPPDIFFYMAENDLYLYFCIQKSEAISFRLMCNTPVVNAILISKMGSLKKVSFFICTKIDVR